MKTVCSRGGALNLRFPITSPGRRLHPDMWAGDCLLCVIPHDMGEEPGTRREPVQSGIPVEDSVLNGMALMEKRGDGARLVSCNVQDADRQDMD